ncbi:MAG: PHP domain-containing protein [Spirochaetia bacterium]|nr:PHP domain-containing protein [Spirochaetia bacterium]
MIDLHVHTTASDGQYSPTEIIEKAASKNISLMAITDHDTAAGIDEAAKAAKKNNITLIPGTELNISFPTGEFHLLGLGFTHISPSLQSIFDKLIQDRNNRNYQIIEKMKSAGIEISLEEIQTDFPNTIIGRPHFAAELQKKGIVKTRQQAFDQYLAKGRPMYVERTGANLDESIVAIKESGGVPVIAHPMSLYLSWGKLPDQLINFYERGVLGMEAFHPGARVTECLRLEELAKKIGFFVTAGSDFHGEKIRADRKLGHTCGNKKIEKRFWLEELKPNLPQFN